MTTSHGHKSGLVPIYICLTKAFIGIDRDCMGLRFVVESPIQWMFQNLYDCVKYLSGQIIADLKFCDCEVYEVTKAPYDSYDRSSTESSCFTLQLRELMVIPLGEVLQVHELYSLTFSKIYTLCLFNTAALAVEQGKLEPPHFSSCKVESAKTKQM